MSDVPTTPKTPITVAPSAPEAPPHQAEEFDLITVLLGLAILAVAVYGFRRGRKPPDKKQDPP
jgi:hypothetical protein